MEEMEYRPTDVEIIARLSGTGSRGKKEECVEQKECECDEKCEKCTCEK